MTSVAIILDKIYHSIDKLDIDTAVLVTPIYFVLYDPDHLFYDPVFDHEGCYGKHLILLLNGPAAMNPSIHAAASSS